MATLVNGDGGFGDRSTMSHNGQRPVGTPSDEDGEFRNLTRDGVVRDFVDLRDQIYQPTLGRLLARQDLTGLLASVDGPDRISDQEGPWRPKFGVRQQGATGRCTGYALAALIDIQRRLQDPDGLDASDRRHEQVSADMLYFMARFHEDFSRGGDNGGERLASAPSSEGVRSLRSVIKGFYHHGVCLDQLPSECPADPEARWRSSCHFAPDETIVVDTEPYPTVAQAKAARHITLGAYYRLRPVLNDYHAALNETGTVLVSAHLHEGWARSDVERNAGRIDWAETKAPVGAHAFVIAGYNEEGFLVLNSWGDGWGGFGGIQGLALWPYADWARNIIDGWVLRLGVSAPGAFDVSIGEQGASKVFGRIRAGSTPYLELMGHFAHLDDGHYVRRGAYPYSPRMLETTFSYLEDALEQRAKLANSVKLDTAENSLPEAGRGAEAEPYRGIVLWMPASLEGMKQTYEQAVQHKKVLKEFGLYPYNIFWCSDFVEDAMRTLAEVFAKCAKQAGDDAEHLDQLIEKSVRGVGRAFWRDVKLSARRAVLGPDVSAVDTLARGFSAEDLGPVASIFHKCLDLGAKNDLQIHIVTEGAGGLLLDEILRVFANPAVHQISPNISEAWKHGHHALRSINMALPTISTDRAEAFLFPLLSSLNDRFPQLAERDPNEPLLRIDAGPTLGSGTEPRTKAEAMIDHMDLSRPPARVYVPSQDMEDRLRVAEYSQSISRLIANAFEDKPADSENGEAKILLGQAGVAETIAPNGANGHAGLRAAITELGRGCVDGTEPVEQVRLAREPRLRREIYQTLKQHSELEPTLGGDNAPFRF